MRLKGKKIIVGVTGSIAVYKSCSLVNNLLAEGAEVRVVMTESAKQFVTPLTFQSLTNHPVYDDLWNPADLHTVEHISLSHWADVVVVAPITANTLAKLSFGMADNLLTTIVLASLATTKIILAPAMNVCMWDNPLTQENIARLTKTQRFTFVDPRSGVLACRDEGKGKIAETKDIIDSIIKSL